MVLIACRDKKKFSIDGRAQGTTYHISYLSSRCKIYQLEIDSLLLTLDKSLSNYDTQSIISKINNNDDRVRGDKYFRDVFEKSVEVARRTDGFFDFTVGPLIDGYGFGAGKKLKLSDSTIDSLLKFVGYKKVRLEGDRVVKEDINLRIDFNAIAQGYSVDVISRFLEARRIRDYVVELGGEVRAAGKNENNEPWKVGIDAPTEMQTGLHAVVKLQNRALATSGNYRRFYEENGRRFAHIIDPRTGLPGEHNLLSASVMAADCMSADAYATAFMAMGMDNARLFLRDNSHLGLEVFFIYDEDGEWRTYASKGAIELIDTPRK